MKQTTQTEKSWKEFQKNILNISNAIPSLDLKNEKKNYYLFSKKVYN